MVHPKPFILVINLLKTKCKKKKNRMLFSSQLEVSTCLLPLKIKVEAKLNLTILHREPWT